MHGRSIKFIIDYMVGKAFKVNCRVPRGFALRSLIYFLIYVDKMHFYHPDAVVTSFTDDTALTVIAKSIEDLIEKTNITLETLYQFAKHSCLAVNIETRPGRGCIDNIFGTRLIIQQFRCKLPLSLIFLDYTAAFDPVTRHKLWKILEIDGKTFIKNHV